MGFASLCCILSVVRLEGGESLNKTQILITGFEYLKLMDLQECCVGGTMTLSLNGSFACEECVHRKI